MEESKNKFTNVETNNSVIPTSDEWRYDEVLKLQKEMEKELIKYETVYNKYKKGDKICTAITVTSNFIGTACSTSAITVATTVALAGVAIPLAVISGLSYVSAIAATVVGKKVSSKRAKHLAISKLVKSSSLTLSKYVSKIIQDGKIDEREFDMICKLVEDYREQKNEIRKKKIDIEKVMQEAEINLSKKFQQYLTSPKVTKK